MFYSDSTSPDPSPSDILFDNNIQPINMTAFQIFCHQSRPRTASVNPHLKGTAITGLLAQIWRAMDSDKRSYFEKLSASLRNESKKKQKDPVPIEMSEKPFNLYVPKLFVVSRNGFGKEVFTASYNLFSNGSADSDVESVLNVKCE